MFATKPVMVIGLLEPVAMKPPVVDVPPTLAVVNVLDSPLWLLPLAVLVLGNWNPQRRYQRCQQYQ